MIQEQINQEQTVKELQRFEFQKQILADAGNNQNLMVAESAFPDTFDPNKILYRRIQVGAEDIFEYSNDENEPSSSHSFSSLHRNYTYIQESLRQRVHYKME